MDNVFCWRIIHDLFLSGEIKLPAHYTQEDLGLGTDLQVLLPQRHGLGLCSTALVSYLITLHNDLVYTVEKHTGEESGWEIHMSYVICCVWYSNHCSLRVIELNKALILSTVLIIMTHPTPCIFQIIWSKFEVFKIMCLDDRMPNVAGWEKKITHRLSEPCLDQLVVDSIDLSQYATT